MPLEEYVTFNSLFRYDVISLDSLLKDTEDTILTITPDEKVLTEDDLIEIIDKAKKLEILKSIVVGLTKKEKKILGMRFGLQTFI